MLKGFEMRILEIRSDGSWLTLPNVASMTVHLKICAVSLFGLLLSFLSQEGGRRVDCQIVCRKLLFQTHVHQGQLLAANQRIKEFHVEDPLKAFQSTIQMHSISSYLCPTMRHSGHWANKG